MSWLRIARTLIRNHAKAVQQMQRMLHNLDGVLMTCTPKPACSLCTTDMSSTNT